MKMRDLKIISLSALMAIVIMTVACGSETRPANTPQAATPAPAGTLEWPKNGNYNAKGKVTKINNELGSIELDHGDIPGLMPPMIMEFFVKDKALMKDIKVGDQVDFVIEYNHPAETVVEIKKTQ